MKTELPYTITNPHDIEGLMRSLDETQKNAIRKESITNPHDWAVFRVTVFNAGAVVAIDFKDSPAEIDPDTWNGYDVSIQIDDVVTLLDKYNL